MGYEENVQQFIELCRDGKPVQPFALPNALEIEAHIENIGSTLKNISGAETIRGMRTRRSGGVHEFDQTVHELLPLLQVLVTRSEARAKHDRLCATVSLRIFLEKVFHKGDSRRYIAKTHVAVALACLGYEIDFGGDPDYFKANWKWAWPCHLNDWRTAHLKRIKGSL